MTTLPSEDAVRDAIDPRDVHALRILQLALTTGPLAFVGVALLLPTKTDPSVAPELVLSIAHGAMTLGCWSAAAVISSARLRAAAAEQHATPPGSAADAAARWTGVHRATRILTLALLEGSALFGVVVLFLARSRGVDLQARPELGAHLIPLAVLALFAVATFPSADQIARSWRHDVLEATPPLT